MSKKVIITVICIIIVILVCFSIGIVLGDKKVPNDNSIQGTVDKEEENKEQEVVSKEPEKSKNVVLNSKIGNEVRNKIKMDNIYSNYFFNEIEKNGLSDKAKLIFTFSRITRDGAYSDLIRYNEKYADGYITSDDLHVVLKKIFNNSENVKDANIFNDSSFDEADSNYVIVPTGFVNYSYIIDVPYKIEEYDEKIEVLAYRLYIDTTSIENETGEEQVKNMLYYDMDRKSIALDTQDKRMDDPDTQDDFVLECVEQLKLNKSKLKSVKYTLVKKGTNYLLDNVE